MENQHLVSPSRQWSRTLIGFGSKGFFSKEQYGNSGASIILFWPGSSWFLLVPPMKLAVKRWRFCNNNEIIKHAKERLKKLSQNGFQRRFQHSYSHWQKCIAAQGDYFEGNDCTVLYFSEIRWFRKHAEAIAYCNLKDYGENLLNFHKCQRKSVWQERQFSNPLCASIVVSPAVNHYTNIDYVLHSQSPFVSLSIRWRKYFIFKTAGY